MDAASIRTSTSSGPGVGTGTSSSVRPGADSRLRMARIVSTADRSYGYGHRREVLDTRAGIEVDVVRRIEVLPEDPCLRIEGQLACCFRPRARCGPGDHERESERDGRRWTRLGRIEPDTVSGERRSAHDDRRADVDEAVDAVGFAVGQPDAAVRRGIRRNVGRLVHRDATAEVGRVRHPHVERHRPRVERLRVDAGSRPTGVRPTEPVDVCTTRTTSPSSAMSSTPRSR